MQNSSIHSFSLSSFKIKHQSCNLLIIFHHSWQSPHRVMVGEIAERLRGRYCTKAHLAMEKCVDQEQFIASQIPYRNVGPRRDLFLSYRSSQFSMTTIDLDVQNSELIHPVGWRPWELDKKETLSFIWVGMMAPIPAENVSVGDLAMVLLTSLVVEQSRPRDFWYMTELSCCCRWVLPRIHSLAEKNSIYAPNHFAECFKNRYFI